MTFGNRENQATDEKVFAEPRGMVWPICIFFACVLGLGLYVPVWLDALLNGAQFLIRGVP